MGKVVQLKQPVTCQPAILRGEKTVETLYIDKKYLEKAPVGEITGLIEENCDKYGVQVFYTYNDINILPLPSKYHYIGSKKDLINYFK